MSNSRRRRQVHRRAAAGTHGQVDAVLDLGEIAADFGIHPRQDRSVGAAQAAAQLHQLIRRRQQVAQATPYKVNQRGQAVGLTTWPNPAAPLWPSAEHLDQRSIDYKTPKRTGDVIRSVYTEFDVTWQYYFEANVPLTGSPTLWTG